MKVFVITEDAPRWIEGITPASPADVLRWQGWIECGMCGGTGDNGGGVPEIGEPDPCPDCAHGLVPPDWMTEAAARAMDEAPDDTYMLPSWDQHGPEWREYRLVQGRAALVAAARKEKP